MADTLHVMVIESAPHAADRAVQALESAGHHTHRCHDPAGSPFPCVGLTEPDACPIAVGADVALVVRPRVQPRPTPFESGVRCAIQAGLPIVEDGSETLDPYADWVTTRSTGDVTEACAAAARRAHGPLETAVAERIRGLLVAAGVDPAAVSCRVEPDRPRLHLRLHGPEVSARLQQALAVRALDALRTTRGPTYGQVEVIYEVEGADA